MIENAENFTFLGLIESLYYQSLVFREGRYNVRRYLLGGEDDSHEADDAAEKAEKAMPPGQAKKDEHPSTGKGSEQGQESRAKQEKKWWRFWQ